MIIKYQNPIFSRRLPFWKPSFGIDNCFDPPRHWFHTCLKTTEWNIFLSCLFCFFILITILFIITECFRLWTYLEIFFKLPPHVLNWCLGLKNGPTLNKIQIFYFFISLLFSILIIFINKHRYYAFSKFINHSFHHMPTVEPSNKPS